MSGKVRVFVDPALKQRTKLNLWAHNQVVRKTCFDLIALFLPIAPHGKVYSGFFNDPRRLLGPFCKRFHQVTDGEHTYLSEAVVEAHQIKVIISHNWQRNERARYIWQLDYFLKNQKEPVATATIRMKRDGEITTCCVHF